MLDEVAEGVLQAAPLSFREPVVRVRRSAARSGIVVMASAAGCRPEICRGSLPMRLTRYFFSASRWIHHPSTGSGQVAERLSVAFLVSIASYCVLAQGSVSMRWRMAVVSPRVQSMKGARGLERSLGGESRQKHAFRQSAWFHIRLLRHDFYRDGDLFTTIKAGLQRPVACKKIPFGKDGMAAGHGTFPNPLQGRISSRPIIGRHQRIAAALIRTPPARWLGAGCPRRMPPSGPAPFFDSRAAALSRHRRKRPPGPPGILGLPGAPGHREGAVGKPGGASFVARYSA